MRGIPVGTDRHTVEQLRILTSNGMLATTGATQGKSWKLSPLGVATARAALQLDNELPALYVKISKLSAISKVTLPGTCTRLAMCWDLVPSAGIWLATANKSDAAWRKYQDDLLWLLTPLADLAMLGLIEVYTDAHGQLWGCAPTGTVPTWPNVPASDADPDAAYTAWERGFEIGIRYADKPAPADVSGYVTRMLPTSAWQ